jgi:hypothetical protein
MEENVLADCLRQLAISPVKTDNQAIARLEKQTGYKIDEIVHYLETNSLYKSAFESSLESKPKQNVKIVVCCVHGIFFACIVGLGTLFFRPQLLVTAAALSFGAASAHNLLYQWEKTERENNSR